MPQNRVALERLAGLRGHLSRAVLSFVGDRPSRVSFAGSHASKIATFPLSLVQSSRCSVLLQQGAFQMSTVYHGEPLRACAKSCAARPLLSLLQTKHALALITITQHMSARGNRAITQGSSNGWCLHARVNCKEPLTDTPLYISRRAPPSAQAPCARVVALSCIAAFPGT